MDPITDMFNRIKNAQAVLHPAVEIPFSILKYGIAEILQSHQYIERAEKKQKNNRPVIKITLKYDLFREKKRPALTGFRRISRPGQRIYSSYRKIKPVKSGYGLAIISTPNGLLTGQEARKQKIGGEIIGEVW